MKIFKRSVYAVLLALGLAGTMQGADYGLPSGIQEGNILHCFNWPITDIKAELANIAAAGFGSIQISPCQRPDVKAGTAWHDLYRPYDLAFKSSSYCSEADLRSLCSEAANYGIKIIVDVVANHVDKTAGYHDTWWDSNGRVRWNGGINYGDRYSITHGQLGDYGDINSEDSEVIARGKAYVEKLKSLGVKGVRWDAAKHIGLPSEQCGFWSAVTSVSGVWHYGEILDNPGPNATIIKEYVKYMSVTDNQYCNYAARENGGIPGGYAGDWVVNQSCPDTKMVYWAESHDTYSNDEWSQNVDQSVIDRAYAAYASRNGATALYLSRPNTKGFNNIKVAKGSLAFKNKHIAEVNKFRNVMVGKKDWFESNGNACSITRQNGGAVIVMKGSGNVSVKNGGGYCPAGTYTDRVSGATFTVTASTISGNVGSTGIAVIYNDGVTPDPNPDPTPDPEGDMWILGNLKTGGWSTTPGAGAAMTLTDGKYKATGVEFAAAAGETKCYFNLTDYVGATWDDLNMNANRYGAATEGVTLTAGTPATVVKYANNVDASACKSWTIAAGKYDIVFDPSAMTITVTGEGVNPDPNPDPTTVTITGDYNIAYSGSKANVYYWGGSNPSTSWPGIAMTTVTGSDGKSYKVAKIDATSTNCIFNTNGDQDKTGVLTYSGKYIMNDNGPTSTAVIFKQGDNPNPNPDPSDVTIYYDNSNTNWNTVKIYYWDNPKTSWPGVDMTKVEGNIWKYTFTEDPSALKGFIFNNGSGDQTGDYTKVPVANHIYKGNGNKGAVTDEGEYQGGNNPEKPVVVANPASGTRFAENLTVTLTVTPAATIYYTLDGNAATTSSTKYTSPISLTETTTIKTLAVTAEGGQNAQSFSYTKSTTPINPPAGNTLITDYYKVNPNGQVGTNKTINVSLNGQKATNALSNWTDRELIAQGVARDVCQAFKGVHERPIVDSYALYAAYDHENLYLGVQYVYTVWDLYGEGKQPGESKPYNMDGKLCFAFDLDPNKSAEGITNENTSIWQDAVYTTFDNGADAWWYGSTKPGVGTPGFFVPNANGICDYTDPNSCKTSTVKYGYADGLLPSITAVYGQENFGYDPELLKGNTGFTDLSGEIDNSAHTFYEYKFPLSLLGVTEDYIKNTGIGVMVVDFYGASAHSSLPYDPSFFDNVNESYSQDPSSSKEKEDKDLVTYSLARVGKARSVGVNNIADETGVDTTPVYFNLQGVRVINPESGIYIVRRGNKVTKEVIR